MICSSVNLLLRMSVSRRNGLYPNSRAFKGSTSGQLIFNNACRTCHTTKEGDNRLGPNLHNIIGRKAGSLPSFGYSSAMKGADFVWDKEKLDSFIAKPDEVVPGNNMKPYGGLASAEDRTKLIAFLQSPAPIESHPLFSRTNQFSEPALSAIGWMCVHRQSAVCIKLLTLRAWRCGNGIDLSGIGTSVVKDRFAHAEATETKRTRSTTGKGRAGPFVEPTRTSRCRRIRSASR